MLAIQFSKPPLTTGVSPQAGNPLQFDALRGRIELPPKKVKKNSRRRKRLDCHLRAKVSRVVSPGRVNEVHRGSRAVSAQRQQSEGETSGANCWLIGR